MNMFSHVLLCLTVSKGSTEVSACIELLSALVLQFKRLRALMMIMRTERESSNQKGLTCPKISFHWPKPVKVNKMTCFSLHPVFFLHIITITVSIDQGLGLGLSKNQLILNKKFFF